MMVDGNVSAHDLATMAPPSITGNLAGHLTIGALLRAQDAVPERGRLARIFGKSPLGAETQPLYQRAVGEIEVGMILDTLGAEWVVLHALPKDVGSSEINHLVIGPGGVFAVATKNHSGLNVWASERTFMAEGIRYPYIRNLEYEIGAAEQMLSTAAGHEIKISGILAVVTPKSLEVPDEHRDVAIVSASDVVHWLGSRPRIFSATDVRSISAAASLASTWYVKGAYEETPEHLRTAFERLRTSVKWAARIQLAWVIGASTVMVGGFIFVTYSILMNAFTSFRY
jgi:Nuclease-related domain